MILGVDSGQGSSRRLLVESLLRYLVYLRGIPTAVLSTDPTVTTAFLAVLPPRLKSTVYGLGSYHLYLQVAQRVHGIHQKLFLDPEHIGVVKQAYLSVLYPLRTRLIRDLGQRGISVILDRTVLSTHAYAACLPKASADIVQDDYESARAAMDPETHYFYLDSPRRTNYNVSNARLYDLMAPQLNIKLRCWYRGLNNLLPSHQSVVIIPGEDSPQQMLVLVKERLKVAQLV